MAERRWLSIQDFAREVGVSKRTIRRMVVCGELPHIRIGWQYRIDYPKAIRVLGEEE